MRSAPVKGVAFKLAPEFAHNREIAGELVLVLLGMGDGVGAIDRRHGLCMRPPCDDSNSSRHFVHLYFKPNPLCFSSRCRRAFACLSSVLQGPPPLGFKQSPHLREGGTGKGMTTWS